MTRIILIILSLSFCTFGAIYKGKSIDGKKYAASVKTGKVIVSCDVIFEGKAVYIYSDVLVTGKLSSEIISDPHDIEITVGREAWTVDIIDALP